MIYFGMNQSLPCISRLLATSTLRSSYRVGHSSIYIFRLIGTDYPSPWAAICPKIVVPQNFDSKESLKSAKTWFKNCEQNHTKCSIQPTFLPTRFLDLYPSDGLNEIKFIDTNHLDITSRYIALSHCWGKEQIITTTRATEGDRRQSIKLDQLLKTFHDAVIVSRQLNIQYLWIDRLCIVQGDVEDWQEESGKMALVYQHACLVISASASADGRGSCFSSRTFHDPRCMKFQGSSHGTPFVICAKKALPHTIQSATAKQDPRLPLFSRG